MQHQPVDDVLNAIRDKDSEHGKTFRRLKQTLESTWTLFTDNEIISADELQIQGESRTLLDVANLAMLSSWLVEGSSESYSKADSNFLSIFNSSISDLPSGAPDLYLAIKTQKTIEALLVKPVEKDTATLITECMTDGMEEKVRSQHAGQELTAADQAFLTVVRARQDELQTETKEKIDKGLSFPITCTLKNADCRSCIEKEAPCGRSITVHRCICQDSSGCCFRSWSKIRRSYRIGV